MSDSTFDVSSEDDDAPLTDSVAQSQEGDDEPSAGTEHTDERLEDGSGDQVG